MDPKVTIKNNIIRKKPILDREPQFYNSVPLPSWIELSLIDACNRSCSFCPKVDENIAPNTYQKMELSLIDKLCTNLKKINFEGAFCLCGYGEPLLHKDHLKIINRLSQVGQVEIITNGDTLNESRLIELYESKASRVLISLYDGEEQIKKFNTMILNTNVPRDFVVLRDRWYSDKKDYGVKLTNRVGTIKIGNQVEVNLKQKCYYTSYQVLIDWNGDFFLCPQDWQRRMSMGNIMQKDFFEIWNGQALNKYRKKHLEGNRSLSPCNNCNADGDVYGEKHAKVWDNYYTNKI
jgi:radical SAM protein with 4Fe4S-binding SPASM domain|tara:strand:- start:3074 stop:3949 length:876 start_codon:yes stop_codon:yes gene_type:complete